MVLCGQSEVVENIIKRGGQVNFKESEIEYTPLHLAAAKGKIHYSCHKPEIIQVKFIIHD